MRSILKPSTTTKGTRRPKDRWLQPVGAAIIHRADGTVSVRVEFPDHAPVWRRAGRSEERAQEIIDRLVAEREASLEPGGGEMTFSQLVTEWQKVLDDEGYKESSIERHLSAIRVHLEPRWGRRQLAEITPWQIRQYRSDRRKAGASKSTISNELNALSVVLDLGIELNLIAANPVQASRRRARGKYRSTKKILQAPGTVNGRALPTSAEVQDFLESIPLEHPDRDTIRFIWNTAARVGEAGAVTFDDVTVEGRTVGIEEGVTWVRGLPVFDKPKSPNSLRVIPVSQAAIDAVVARLPDGDPSGRRVFTEPDGRPLRASNLGHRFKTLARRAGHADWTLHLARHYIASLLVTRGFTAHEVAWYLGDSPEMVQRVYGHLFEDAKMSVGLRMASVIEDSTAPRAIDAFRDATPAA